MSSKQKLKKTNSNSKECDMCVSLVGPIGCGKSALLVKYLTHRFIGEYDPLYEGCWTKCENCDGIDVNIQIMDTYDKDRNNLKKYIKWSDALVLVYSVTCYESFIAVQEYLEQICEIIKKNADDSSEKNEKSPLKIILLGNKIDIERHRQVNKQEVELLVEKYSNSNNNSLKPLPQNGAENAPSSINNNEQTSVSLNIIHLESTSCEEFELVQNLFHRIIREIRQQRELVQLSNPLHIIEEASPKTIKSRSNISTLNNKNRTKSPKHLSVDSSSGSMININNTIAGNQSNISVQGNYVNMSNCNQLPTNKDGSLKKNKFPFLNKILNNKNF